NLDHEAFPRVTHHFFEGEGQYLVMELIRGVDLWELLQLRETPFPPAKVLEWADQLLDALTELHSNVPPIVHRDIKPPNMKLTPRGKIKLLDFGIAKGAVGQMAMNTSEPLSAVGFTPHFAPLEQSLRSDRRWVETFELLNSAAVESIL
ncbi:MAG: protein kinase, partial [Pyrinomonadaceae bacterium]